MVTLGAELMPHVEEIERLLRHQDPVTAQQVLELLTARHATRFQGRSRFVAESMHKHVRQILRDFIVFSSN
jgi:hypothetical protein